MEMAFCPSSLVSISTKPNPRGWPVCRSVIILAEDTLPASVKSSLSSVSVICMGRLPTYNLIVTIFSLSGDTIPLSRRCRPTRSGGDSGYSSIVASSCASVIPWRSSSVARCWRFFIFSSLFCFRAISLARFSQPYRLRATAHLLGVKMAELRGLKTTGVPSLKWLAIIAW